MAKVKIADLSTISGAVASGDLLPFVDVSDTTDSAEGTTKKVTSANLLGAGINATVGSLVVNSTLGVTGTTTLAATTIAGAITATSQTLAIGAITSSGALALGSNTITSGLINGQTISSAANFTGTLGVTGLMTLSDGASINDGNGIPVKIQDIAATPSSQTAGFIGMSTSAYSGRNGDLVLFPRTSDVCKILLMGGDVGIGTTTITTGILEVKSTSEYTACINTWNSSGSNDNQFLYFYTDSGRTSRGLINFNRSAGLVQYLTTSDYRAKNIIGKFEANNIIDDLKVWNGKMNEATIERPMFIAHEVQEIIPYAVSGIKDAEIEQSYEVTPKVEAVKDVLGNIITEEIPAQMAVRQIPLYQQIDHQIFVPLIVAELQSLRKRVKELENV